MNNNRKEQKAMELEILNNYLRELVPELNLRMFLDGETPETVLWIDSITVIEYTKPEQTTESLPRRIWNHLTGKPARSGFP